MTNHSDLLDSYEHPALDCHAHIAADVTRSQLSTLNGTYLLAVTRSLREAQAVKGRDDAGLTWGIGVHPAVPRARTEYDPDLFRALLPGFALVGEVGLDKRGAKEEQGRILDDVMRACRDQPVLISMHSAGMASGVADIIERHPHPGTILHWWLGTPTETQRAIASDVFFSINAAMDDQRLAALPRNRVLPETDFPARSVRARLPGDIARLESRISSLWKVETSEVRRQWWMNLRDLSVRSGALDRVNDALADAILTA